MRKAIQQDVGFIAQCFVNISTYLKANFSDIYIDGLPDAVDKNTVAIAGTYVDNDDALALIVEQEQQQIACIAASIAETSFSPAGIGRVGHIAICWVDERYRNKQIASALIKEVECWFGSKNIDVVELSYMAQNALAANAWSKAGYTPFRVYSHKVLNKV